MPKKLTEEDSKLSRQRRWQKRHPEKFKAIKRRYMASEKGQETARAYQKKYRERKKDELGEV